MRPDGRRMTRRDWENGDARAIGVFLNGDELASETKRGEPVRDESFLLLFNAYHEEIAFRLPARRFGTRWEVELATGRVDGDRLTPAPTSPSSRGRQCSSGVAEFRATYRLQLTPDFGFAEARQLVPVSARPRHLASLPLAVAAGARRLQHGYDVTDPRHISPELGGEEEFRKLATSGLGVILDIVPNHMLAGDESPFWRDERLREMVYDVDLRTGFHRRFFDIGELGGVKQEDWEVFWATHAKVIELARGGPDRRRARRPSDGLADPEEYFERLRDAGVGTRGPRRSSSRARSCATGRSRARRATSS